jgi:hypothetical protein
MIFTVFSKDGLLQARCGLEKTNRGSSPCTRAGAPSASRMILFSRRSMLEVRCETFILPP